MHELPDVQREALILVGVGGSSYGEVATLMGSAIGTAKSRVGRARQSLRKILDRQRSPWVRPRGVNGNAVNEILGQLNQFSRVDATVAA